MRAAVPRTRRALAGCVCAALLGIPPVIGLAADIASTATPEDIRDIRGPKIIGSERILLPAIVAGAVLLGLCAYGIWRWRHRAAQVRELLPHESALRRLEEIRALMQPENAREFAIAVSDVIRHYVEQRFGIIATQRTTEEFLQDLLGSPDGPLNRFRERLGEFLRECDLVKFAATSPSLPVMEALHDNARTFVRESAELRLATARQTSNA